jgi:hypothetical protein
MPEYATNDLSFYANIPVPTSYMCMGSREDFFGGYDHRAQAGIVHLANHHIAPGKKQWTWGNHEFGYAWDRNLTDPDAQGIAWPYIEIMAGVYTDNQPDCFLQPGRDESLEPAPVSDPADRSGIEYANLRPPCPRPPRTSPRRLPWASLSRPLPVTDPLSEQRAPTDVGGDKRLAAYL